MRVAVKHLAKYTNNGDTMDIDDIMTRVLSLFPDAEIADDSEGQIVVYTGLYPAVKSGEYGKYKEDNGQG